MTIRYFVYKFNLVSLLATEKKEWHRQKAAVFKKSEKLFLEAFGNFSNVPTLEQQLQANSFCGKLFWSFWRIPLKRVVSGWLAMENR